MVSYISYHFNLKVKKILNNVGLSLDINVILIWRLVDLDIAIKRPLVTIYSPNCQFQNPM